MERYTGVLGILAVLLTAYLFSTDRKRIRWRTVAWGLGLQLTFAFLVLRFDYGQRAMTWAGGVVNSMLACTFAGTKMLFGQLGLPNSGAFGNLLPPNAGAIFAFQVLPTIIFISAFFAILYHVGIMQLIIRGFAWVMLKTMRISGAESLNVAASVFMGQTEAPLMIRPYVPRLTRSELMTIMVCGMAHIAGGVAAVYANMGFRAGYPNTAGHLLTASVLNCPAALLIAKILLPETEKSETAASAPATVPRTTANSIDAICRGAGDGFNLALNVIAMLIGFIAMIALANYVVTWPQTHLGISHPATLQNIFGWINAPFAWLMGVPAQDCFNVGQILGERIVLNEFVGFLDLTANAKQLALDPRSFTIATYALCGFANFASIAIQVGGIGSLAPERRSEMAKIGFRAMCGGLLAAYMTACLAGILL